MEKCVQILKTKVGNSSEKIEQLQECINTRNLTYDTYCNIFEVVTFTDITKEFSDEIKNQIDAYVDGCINMKDIILVEMMFIDCKDYTSILFTAFNKPFSIIVYNL